MKHAIVVALIFCTCASWADDEKPAQPAFKIQDCYQKMWADERASLARSRLGVGMNPIPLDLRSSKAKASTKEKASVSFLAEQMQLCSQQDAGNRKLYYPEALVIVTDLERENLAIMTKLYAGDMTWGEAITANQKNNDNYNQRATVLQAKIDAALKEYEQQQEAKRTAEEYRRITEQRAEEDRRVQRASQAAQEAQLKRQYDQQQFMNGLMLLNAARPQIQPMPLAPSFGTSCRSRAWGGTVYTNCD